MKVAQKDWQLLRNNKLRVRGVTNEEINKTQFGPNTDALIAVEVMGWKIFDFPTDFHNDYVTHLVNIDGELEIHRPLNNLVLGWSYGDIWRPYKDISQACEILEKLHSKFDIFITRHASMEGWEVVLENKECGEIQVEASNLPFAICGVALKAVNR